MTISTALEIVAAVCTLATLAFLVIDKLRGGGAREAKTIDGLVNLSVQMDRVETNITKVAEAGVATTAMAVKLSQRTDEHERRLGAVENVRDSFASHAATDIAEHKSMRESIERLSRTSENVSAQIARLVPADTYSELISGSKRRRAEEA